MKKGKKIELNEFEKMLLEYLYDDVIEMVEWECGATDPGIVRDALRKVVKERLGDLFVAEIMGFKERLANQVAVDLRLPKNIDVYGENRFVPDGQKEKVELVKELEENLAACRNKKY